MIRDDDSLRRFLPMLLDVNQRISERQARLVAMHDPLHLLLMKRAASDNDVAIDTVRGDVTKNFSSSSIAENPMSYLYYIGVLTLAEAGTDALSGNSALKIPNWAARVTFVEALRLPSASAYL
jgi:hypothetical protein